MPLRLTMRQICLWQTHPDNTIHLYSSTGDDLGTFASTGLNLPDGLAFEPMVQATPEPGMLALAAAGLAECASANKP
jgi:hypothetical protein